ncbi:hypothetical protein PG991_010214 [Apiospora marii]|uniref:3-beta hydroxysteroid dehydrogenase/isomerase domain-containing protein n=1 Tax=Apiospora marii TaxID=335849 RepID=A0ABR1RHT0_9PEZI
MAPPRARPSAAVTSPSSPPPLLGPVLVVGGCGFLGHHLVAHLLADPACAKPVYVLDPHIEGSENRHHADQDVIYIEGSIADPALVTSVLARARPRVVLHAASPVASLPRARWAEFEAVNVVGTRILLSAFAASTPETSAVKALVYTSSPDVYANPPHHDISETHPLVSEDDQHCSEYVRTKAAAQRLVLAANSPTLRTCALLPAHMYGERSTQGLPEILALCADRDGSPTSSPLIQLGPGTNLVSVASAANVARAHLLAAKALLDPSRVKNGVVAGESFNITDGRPVAFWNEHVRAAWKEARGLDDDASLLRQVIVVPGWIYRLIAWIARLLVRTLTLGTVSPPAAVSEQGVLYALGEHTYSVEKLRGRLGFEPVRDHERVMRQAVRWELDRRRRQGKGEVGR